MRYSAVALSESDLGYDDTYLGRQRAVATFPFLAPRCSGAPTSRSRLLSNRRDSIPSPLSQEKRAKERYHKQILL